MASTYTPIATNTLTSAGNNISFSSIPSTYTDLRLIVNGTLISAESLYIRLNSDSNTNYSNTLIYGDGTTAASLRDSNANQLWVGYGNTNANMLTVDIMNYSNTTTFKTALSRSSSAATSTSARVGLWRNTSAISTVLIYGANNFTAGSTFSLYGIKAA